MAKHVADAFRDYFDLVLATTEALKNSAYALRYRVYCVETGFEQAELFPDGMEKDEYDIHAEHYLVRHRDTGLFAATARLILPNINDINQPFPVEKHCHLGNISLLENIPRTQIAEVSRFCVSEQFKRREGERNTLAGIGPHKLKAFLSDTANTKRALPYITLALISCIIRMGLDHNITHLYVFIEPSFARLLRFLGIELVPVGPLIDYHGKRQPYIIHVPSSMSRIKNRNIGAWEILTNCGEIQQDEPALEQPSPLVKATP